MSSDQPLGFWLRLQGEWRPFELGRLDLQRISGFGGSITDPDARHEPLPLLAQHLDTDGLRCRTRAFTVEAEVEPRDRSNRAVQDPDDPVVQACTRSVSVGLDVR